eukprot:scpid90422/ scgid9475/ 
MMHEICEKLLPALLVSHGKSAPSELKQQPMKHEGLVGAYMRIAGAGDTGNELLVKLIAMFVKGKQKAVVRHRGLQPAQTSVTLHTDFSSATERQRDKQQRG